PLQILGVDMRVRYHGNGLVNVIKDHHAVVEGKRQVGELAVISRRVVKALDVANGIVAGKADGSSAEPGQAGHMRRSIGGQPAFEGPQGIVVHQLGDYRWTQADSRRGVERAVLDLHPVIECLEAQKRPGANKTVAPDALAPHDAFEEKRPIFFLDLAEGT